MQRIAFDFEANGLVHDVSELWCIATKDLDTGETTVCSDYPLKNVTHDLQHGIDLIDQADVVYAHNGIGYDAPVLKKLYGIDILHKLKDTYVGSQVCFPKLESAKENPNQKHGHGIEVWGERIGIAKVKNEDWSSFTQNILDRCIVDVDIMCHLINEIGMRMKEHPALKDVFTEEQKVYARYIENCSEVTIDTVMLDRSIKRLESLQERLMSKIGASIPMRFAKQPEKPHKAFKKDGTISTATKNWCFKEDIVESTIHGDFTKLMFPNVNSNKQVIEWLLSTGWKPDTRTASGAPSLQGSAFIGVPKKVQHRLNNNNILRHRLGLLRGIRNKLDGDKLRPFANTSGTNTRRFEHKILVNMPRVTSKLGYPLRAIFKPIDGHVLVGADASGLEARVEAHYTYTYDDGEYAEEILNGDIHANNAKAFNVDRNTAKGGKYALTYGCGVGKLADLLGMTEPEAQKAYKAFWAANTSLKSLKDSLDKSVKARAGHRSGRYAVRKGVDYIKTVDGSPILVRGMSSLVNSLFQSAGSIIMKKAFLTLCDKLAIIDSTAKVVIFMHDEFQISCRPEVADEVGQAAVDAIKAAGEHFKLNVPLDGEYKIGDSWAKTH